MNKKRGLTVLEIILVLIFIITISSILVYQKSNLDALHRDDTRKSAVNAIYYALEESYYKDHGYYPEYINSKTLTVINPDNFTDPSGYSLDNPKSSYSYLPANCYLNRCQEYILTAALEKEPTYTKYSLSHRSE